MDPRVLLSHGWWVHYITSGKRWKDIRILNHLIAKVVSKSGRNPSDDKIELMGLRTSIIQFLRWTQRKDLRDTATWSSTEIEDFIENYPVLSGNELQIANQIKGKSNLVLLSLLQIHDRILNSWDVIPAAEGYEGKPLQVETLYWQVWGVLARNKFLTTPEEVTNKWLEECGKPQK